MFFGESLNEIRSRRRMPMRELGVPPSLIHDIEKKDRLPKPKDLDVILAHIGEVAIQQGSENGEQEKNELRGAWLADHFVRIGVSAEIAPTLAHIALLDPSQQETFLSNFETTVLPSTNNP